MNKNKSIINKICQAPIKVFQSKLKYAITIFKIINPFSSHRSQTDRLEKISISIKEGIIKIFL